MADFDCNSNWMMEQSPSATISAPEVQNILSVSLNTDLQQTNDVHEAIEKVVYPWPTATILLSQLMETWPEIDWYDPEEIMRRLLASGSQTFCDHQSCGEAGTSGPDTSAHASNSHQSGGEADASGHSTRESHQSDTPDATTSDVSTSAVNSMKRGVNRVANDDGDSEEEIHTEKHFKVDGRLRKGKCLSVLFLYKPFYHFIICLLHCFKTQFKTLNLLYSL